MIETWTTGRADDNMPEQILAETREIIVRHPWWLARAELVLALLRRAGVAPPASVLDVGCGWGVTLARLEAAGFQAVGLDISRGALELLKAPGRLLIEADLGQALPTEAGCFDALLALDVIEHLDDDVGAVSRLARLLAPGAPLVVSVPALPALFSEFDQVQGHRRRYTRATLAAAFSPELYELQTIFWWGAWMVPFLALRQLSSPRGGTPTEIYRRYLRLPPRPGLAALRWAFSCELPLALGGLLPLGTSLVALARRRPRAS